MPLLLIILVAYVDVSRQPLQRRKSLQPWVNNIHCHTQAFGYLLDGDVGHVDQFTPLNTPDVLTCQSGTSVLVENLPTMSYS